MTIETTLAARELTHGDFSTNALVAQALKGICIEHASAWWEIAPVYREAVENILQKVSRIIAGSEVEADHWHDIQGYAKLAEEYAIENSCLYPK